MFDAKRHELHTKVRLVLGDDVGDTLMDHLPPAGWSDLVTNSRLDGEMKLLRKDLESGLAILRNELESGLMNLRNEFRTEMNEMKSDLIKTMNSQLRWIVTLFASQFVALLAIALRA